MFKSGFERYGAKHEHFCPLSHFVHPHCLANASKRRLSRCTAKGIRAGTISYAVRGLDKSKPASGETLVRSAISLDGHNFIFVELMLACSSVLRIMSLVSVSVHEEALEDLSRATRFVPLCW